MIDLILKVIRAILRSLYLLFEGIPALEALRRWFGAEGTGGVQTAALVLAGAAMALGAAGFLVFLWLLRGRFGGASAGAARDPASGAGPSRR